MSNTEARNPGRPPKQTESIGAGIKKGKPTWKPASAMEVMGKDPNKRYRWVNKAPDNLAKKETEGWEFTTSGAEHIDADRTGDGKQMTSIRERHDCVLMEIPEDLAQGRDTFFNNKVEQRTKALTAHIKEAAQKEGTEAHGSITISSRKGEQIID